MAPARDPRRTARPHGVRALLLVLAAVPVLFAVLNTNTYAVHAGMSARPMDSADDAARAGDSTRGPATQPPSRGAGEDLPPGHGGDGTPVLHLMGACLAVLLAAGVLVLLARHRLVPALELRRSAPPRSVRRPASWRPPALGPPVLSPVMRT